MNGGNKLIRNIISNVESFAHFSSSVRVTNLPKHWSFGINFTGHVCINENGGVKRTVYIKLVNHTSTHALVLALISFCNIYEISTHI